MRVDIAAAIAAAVLMSSPARAEISSAPDVVVFVEPTLRHALENVGAMFRARTGAPVRIFAAPSMMLVREVPFTRDDVMILEDAVIADALARKVAADAPPVKLGRNHIVVAHRGTGTPRPLAELVLSGPVAIVDAAVPDTLGAVSHGVLAGVRWPAEGARIIGVARDEDATYLLRTGAADYAVVYQTDVSADAAFAVAAPLPDPATPIAYSAALSTHNSSPNAEKFLTFLKSPEAQTRLRADGLEAPLP
jgi:ABC-type molybdate transport system substrate-binding protein